MSKTEKITARYASVLLTHAIQSGALQPICQNVMFLQNQFKEYPTLDSLLHNPTIPGSKKRQLLVTLCQSRVHPTLWRFLEIMLAQHQISQLKAIVHAFEVAYYAHIGMESVVLTTAIALPESLIKRLIEGLKRLVGCKEIRLTKQVDPSIIGGYKLQIGTLKLDKTIKHYLHSLKNHFY